MARWFLYEHRQGWLACCARGRSSGAYQCPSLAWLRSGPCEMLHRP